MDDETDALYDAPLGEFVSARKALAKALRARGARERAAEIDQLAKPTLVAWTLNQLARRDRPLVAAVLAAIDRQRDLQLGALRGALDAEALAAAKQAERGAVRALIERAGAVLRDAGQAASKTNLDKLAKAVRAVALDAGQRERLEAGRLEDEAAASGLEAVASQIDPALLLSALEAEKGKRKPDKRAVDSFLARSVRGDRGGRKVEAPRRADAVDRQAEAARALARAAALRAELEEREREAAAATERVKELERDLEAARREARTAARKVRELRDRLDAAEKRSRLLSS